MAKNKEKTEKGEIEKEETLAEVKRKMAMNKEKTEKGEIEKEETKKGEIEKEGKKKEEIEKEGKKRDEIEKEETRKGETERVETKKQKLSKHRIKCLGIFGGSQLGKDPEFLKAAAELGQVIADKKIHLMYGGGFEGLRSSTALAANVRGGKVLSILVRGLDDWKYTIGSQLRVMTLQERMGSMLYYADTFIALPGGLEALQGISSLTYWADLHFHRKPFGLLNINGFYDSLLSFLDLAVEHGFLPQAIRRTIVSAVTVKQLMDQLQDYTPEPDPRVRQVGWWPSVSYDKQEPPEHEPDTTLRL